MLKDRYLIERMRREMLGPTHVEFKVVEGVGHLLMCQHEPRDVHEGAVRKAENRDVSHVLFPLRIVSSGGDAPRAGPEGHLPRAKRWLRPPKGLIRLTKCLFL